MEEWNETQPGSVRLGRLFVRKADLPALVVETERRIGKWRNVPKALLWRNDGTKKRLSERSDGANEPNGR